MVFSVRAMTADEFGLVTGYFHNATPEFLENMGVDPSRLPPADVWQARYENELHQPANKRVSVVIAWLQDERITGFSSVDKIVYGEHARMHLHVLAPEERNSGVGAPCVRKSADFYFEMLKLKQLFCEPHALNVAPNRTLQKAGFKYLKTYMTVPGPINFHQPVTRWVMER